MATRMPGLPFYVGDDGLFGPMYVDTFAVVPGQPNTLAIAKRYKGVSPRHAGVSIYDNGVARPVSTPGHTGANVIVCGDSPNLIYGYNNETTEYGARLLTISSSGVTTTLTKGSATLGFHLDMVFSGGQLYFTNGDVLLASDFSRVGTFSGADANAVCVDRSGNAIYFATLNGKLLAYTLNTFLPQYSINFASNLSFRRIIKCGDTFALVADGKLLLIPASSLN